MTHTMDVLMQYLLLMDKRQGNHFQFAKLLKCFGRVAVEQAQSALETLGLIQPTTANRNVVSFTLTKRAKAQEVVIVPAGAKEARVEILESMAESAKVTEANKYNITTDQSKGFKLGSTDGKKITEESLNASYICSSLSLWVTEQATFRIEFDRPENMQRQRGDGGRNLPQASTSPFNWGNSNVQLAMRFQLGIWISKTNPCQRRCFALGRNLHPSWMWVITM